MTLSLAWRNMKSRILWSWGLRLVVAALLLAGGSPQQEASSQATNTVPVLQPEADAGAAVGPISTGKPLPPNVNLAGPVSEVIKLANAGMEESVIMAFVRDSTSPFNLGVEEIIYLNGIGVSSSVVTAMMQRDQVLKELSANPAAAPEAPSPGMPANQFVPEPGRAASYAPEPATAFVPPELSPETPPPVDYAAEGYSPPPAADTGDSTLCDSPAPYGTWVDVAGGGPGWPPTVVVINSTWRPAARTISTVRSAPAPRSAAPLILHGPDRPGAVREVFPPHALVVIGSKEGNPHKTARQPTAWTTEPLWSPPTAVSPDGSPHPVANQMPQPIMTAAWVTPAHSEPAWSAPRPTEPPARSEHQRQFGVPTRNGR
jgi:hypothetical protein